VTRLQSFLKEPLLHFLAIGAGLFLWFHFSGGSGAGENRIVITTGQIERLAASYTEAWRRPPTEAELKGLIDDWVREEISVREAIAAGLDRDDAAIRLRLRQKLEFLAEAAADAAPPTDAQLQTWLEENADTFRSEPRVAFRQVFVSRERRGATAEADAAAILARLNATGPEAGIEDVGDATLLPQEMPLASLRDVDRVFGASFGATVSTLTPGAWAGPLESDYGLHLVLVLERVGGAVPELAAVRPSVEREFLEQQRKRQLAALYEGLLAKYEVVVESSNDGS
jgi:hypothetical protein